MHVPSYQTSKNAKALTFFNVLMLVLLFILAEGFEGGASSSLVHTLQENAVSGNGGIISYIFLWIFFAGIVISGTYIFFIPHRSFLKKPSQPFPVFYFAVMLWLAFFLLVDFLLAMAIFFFGSSFSPVLLFMIGMIVTDIVNLGALFVMYYYVVLFSGETASEQLRLELSKVSLQRSCKFFLLGEGHYTVGQLILWGICGYIGFFPLYVLIVFANGFVFDRTGFSFPLQPIVELSFYNTHSLMRIFLFISVVIFAPFIEEFIMRGFILRGLIKRFAPVSAVALSGIIFGAFHFNLFAFIPISALGMFLSWLYIRTGSLLPGIVAHAIFNGINFVGLEVLK